MSELERLRGIAREVNRAVPPTPLHRWPLLQKRSGVEIWVKHENHTPLGAFKVRGGVNYLARLKARQPAIAGIVSATRGNHGQSLAFAARRNGLRAVIVVPEGNSTEKNAAMAALGAELIVHGHDFQAATEHAREIADRDGLSRVPSFHRDLVDGVASYGLEMFDANAELNAVYVPIGLGSGICATIAARDLLSPHTEVIGVVASRAPCYLHSFAAGKPIATNSADTVADGLAVRVPDPEAVDIICRGAARIVEVEEGEIAEAMRHYYTDTHNLAEPAAAAPLAALMKERDAMAGKRVALIHSGSNVDLEIFRRLTA
jgi:threonine dehydratase